MKKTLRFCLFVFLAAQLNAGSQVTVFDDILFYDGYAGVVDYPTPDGVIRHRNDLYARKLTDDELASFGNTLTINVTIGAACDNYDRIGNVNLAFVPKGAETYVPSEVQHLEVARFITPFMNKNVSPTSVPYTFQANNLARIFKDEQLLAAYDIWVEFQVFGVPYAAQTQVAGCAGQIDTFYGTLEFASNTDPVTDAQEFLLPLDFQHNLNNYEEGATDAVGTTVRTIDFDIPTAISNANFYLITSNHGSNAGGEEYNRRFHYIYLDDVLKLTYKPGGVSCEPYRQYNTQPNGIYGSTPRTPAQWASFSNWCPGQVIPIRVIPLGDLAAGAHSFRIEVPTAQFVDGQGYIPVSVYLQGTVAALGNQTATAMSYSLFPNPTTGVVSIASAQEVKRVEVFTVLGQKVWQGSGNTLDLSALKPGVYAVQIIFADGKSAVEKIVRN